MSTILVKIIVILGILAWIGEGRCGSEYGARPCTYLPAPPGRKPPCAGPDDTFCEYPKEYPMQHIRYLINKWGYDYSTLFNDETRDEYFTQPDYGYTYGPVNTQKPLTYENSYYQEPIHIPKPAVIVPEIGNKYIPAPSPTIRINYTNSYFGYPDRRGTPAPKHNGYNSQATNNHINQFNGYQNQHHNHMRTSGYPQNYYARHASATTGSMYGFDPNNWWRYARDTRNQQQQQHRAKRSLESSNNIDIPKNTSAESSGPARSKRQNTLNGERLCQTRSQYIMPRAAVNSKGNWMYVVNLQELDNRFTQLVKSETCANNQQCSGLCGLPNGYTSKCEQKFVQKRLVALEGAGQQLYTDVFWFPSCCVCTISGGNA